MADKRHQVDDVRREIAELDRALLARLEERARLSRKIHKLAEGENLPADVSERDWLASLEKESSGDLPADDLRAVFGQIRAAARALEQPARVAYLGPEGGFCHATARSFFGAGSIYAECSTVAEALEEVARGRAAYAVFPYESSTEGLLVSSIATLEQTDLVLVAERTAAAAYDLMSHTANIADIDKVYATAAAHAACERFLERELPKATVIDVRSPVVAVELAAGDHGSAALGPAPCGRDAELTTVRANVGDTADMSFRYGIAGARPAIRSGKDTTCLLFSVDDTPGALFDVLRHFAERGVNLKKLQSRPVSGKGWDYVFYVEVSGHHTDRPLVTALEAVKRGTKYLKVLGSFPTER
ncbi:MAG: ACT domain-containing protein [Myxococcales bacterium]|nr:ACT domain-containing protein [Myxococcales bacterium]